MSISKFNRFFFLAILFSIFLVNPAKSEGNKVVSNGGEYLPFAEKMPAPIGGLEAIYKKIKYPSIAMQAGIEGKVYLLAFIDENGTVNDVKVLKGIGGGCDEEAAKAVKNTKFTPGSNKGTPVKVKFTLAITFKLR